MATMNISLPDPMKDWVERQSQAGHYSNVSDYMRDLIRNEQERQSKIALLRSLVDEGLADVEQGRVRDLDMEEIKRRGRERLARSEASK